MALPSFFVHQLSLFTRVKRDAISPAQNQSTGKQWRRAL